MKYSDKLKDPRWQIHHLFYLKDFEPWDIPDGFLITLCEDCHFENTNKDDLSITESIINDIGVLLNTLWMKGFLPSDLLTFGSGIFDIEKRNMPLWGIKIAQRDKEGWH